MIGVLDRMAAIVADDRFADLGARQLRVLWVLVIHARDGVAWPTVERIAELARVDERHTRRALRDLEEMGVIRCLHRSRGRVARRYEFAPSVTQGTLGAVLTRADSSRDESAPVEPATLAGSAPDDDSTRAASSRDESAPVGWPTRADSVPNPGQNGPPNPENPSTPPTPPGRGGGEAAPAGRPPERRDQVLELLRANRVGHANPFRARTIVDRALDEGLTDPDLRRLLRLAVDKGDQPAGLLWHWLDDVHRWRSVLDDADLAARERRARAAPSVQAQDLGPRRLADAAGGGL